MVKFLRPTCLERLLTSVNSVSWDDTIGLCTMYHPGIIDYPDEPLCLWKYLGPTIDVEPAITAKILQHNDKVVYWRTYCPLTIEERATNIMQQDMFAITETTEVRLGAKLPVPNLKKYVNLIPQNTYHTLMMIRMK